MTRLGHSDDAFDVSEGHESEGLGGGDGDKIGKGEEEGDVFNTRGEG